jgi:primosomal protein N'
LALIPFIHSFPIDVEHETVNRISQALKQVHLKNDLVATQYLKTNWDVVERVTSKFLRKTDTYFHGAILLEATNAKSLKKSIDELEELVLGQLEPFLHSTRVNYLEQILSFHPKIS